MSGRYIAKCSRCTYERSFSVLPAVYALSDGSTMRVEDGFGWCQDCEQVTPCEELPEQADVERCLEAAKCESDQPLVLELQRTLLWLKGRLSPPHCLTCGSVRIQRFPLGWSVYRDEESDEDFFDIPHPNCDGMLHVQLSGWPLYRGPAARYSPEGERIPDA